MNRSAAEAADAAVASVVDDPLGRHGFGHLLDVGVITPRIGLLYDWSATELDVPGLRERLDGAVPCYAWDPADADVWHPPARPWARCARRTLRPR